LSSEEVGKRDERNNQHWLFYYERVVGCSLYNHVFVYCIVCVCTKERLCSDIGSMYHVQSISTMDNSLLEGERDRHTEGEREREREREISLTVVKQNSLPV